MTQVSSLAHVHPEAQLGQDVVVEPFASIDQDVVVGDGCWIASNAVLKAGTRLGANCQVFPGAVIASVPQDLKFQEEYTTVEVGEGAVIREFATIHRGTSHSQRTFVGEKALVMAYVHVAHDCYIGHHAILSNAVNLAGHVVVGDSVVIGGMCAVHQFTLIGKHAMIAGGSMVRKDVPPFAKAGRDPISYVGVNYRGLSRRGFDNETIKSIQEMYRVIFLSGLNIRQAISQVVQDFPQTPERDDIVEFIRSSERGIMKGYTFMDRC